MHIGIEFKIVNEHGNYLKQILEGISSPEYVWNVTEDEVYTNDFNINNGFLFPQERDTLTNKEFIEIISQESYYTVSVNIKLYKKENDGIIINNYNDFLKSSCILTLNITDNIFVEIYSKDKQILDTIHMNALKNNFSDIKEIIEENKNEINKHSL